MTTCFWPAFTGIVLIAWIQATAADCSWNQCHQWSNDNDVVNLHIVPHSHDDAGWLKTADQYFTGFNSEPGVHVSVYETITNVVTELTRDPTKRFSQCEVAYLYRWMKWSDDKSVQNLINLVNNGQIELVCGGWVQPDEAASHYVDLIDMYTLGLRRLQNTFNSTCSQTRTGWQIDPFGHSREHANLLSLMGYDSLFFAREHHLEHAWRLSSKNLEFDWFTSDEEPTRKLLGGAFYGSLYEPPTGMNWDFRASNNAPIIDNPKLEGYNVDDYKTLLLTEVDLRMASQSHNHLLILMGGDFHYSHANLVFTQLDKLIKIANNNITERKLNAFYSTPNCYSQAVQQARKNWTNKTADFFPYADKAHAYWTGYFTSKPALKGLVRMSSNLVNTVSVLGALANQANVTEYTAPEYKLQKASGLVQHHDGITGTSKEFVTQNYIYRLIQGWTAAESIVSNYLDTISKKFIQTGSTYPQLHFCRNLNESDCDFTRDNHDFTVTVLNSNSMAVNTLIRIPVSETSIAVIDSDDNQVDKAWIVPVFDNKQIKNPHHAAFEVVFYVPLPALGFSTFFVEDLSARAASSSPRKPAQLMQHTDAPATKSDTLANELIALNFDYNGYIESIVDIATGTVHTFKQEFLAYNGHVPKPLGTQTSGAYVFRPETQEPTPLNKFGRVDVTFTYLEVRQVFNDYVSQNIRLFPGERRIEFEWTVGGLPTVSVDGMDSSLEVVTRYSTDIKSNLTCYTDSNGRQMMKRVKNQAPDFTYTDDEPVSGNYYPVTSSALIEDAQNGFVVVTDRSQAAGSLKIGQLEFMVHRKDLYDDGYGVNEPLNEPGKDGTGLVVRGKHWVYFGADARVVRPQMAAAMFHQPILAFSNVSGIVEFTELHVGKYSGLSADLPSNVKVLTLKKLTATTVLLRLEHIYSSKDDPATLSKPASVNLSTLFKTLKVSAARELLLGANVDAATTVDLTNVVLNPLQIRTFEVTVSG